MTIPRMTILLLFVSLASCSRTPGSADSQKPAAAKSGEKSTTDAGLNALFNRIWRISDAPFGPASGSIYIFLANGTLLETSCVETYRIATWSV
jgi:hypothetical protein